MNSLPGPRLTKVNVKDCGAVISLIELFDFAWYNDYIPDKILGQFFGNGNCSLLNWNAKVKKIDNIIAAWRQRDLSYKGKALIINSLLTSSLWYNVTSLAVPPWVIMHIEQAVYKFFWSNKHPLVNREFLALRLKEGGFNIPRLETKVRAFRLNTIRRLLSEVKTLTGSTLRPTSYVYQTWILANYL